MKTLILFLSLCVSASAQTFTHLNPPNEWRLVYSNSNDGWKGPVAVLEVFNDNGLDKIIKKIPLNYQPFNTNNAVTNAYFKTNSVTVIAGTSISIFTNPAKLSTNVVIEALKYGDICAVRGHVWEDGCGRRGCLLIHDVEPMRHCILCKKVERRELGPWK